jgi:ATP-dependent helicase/nuclease subunit A
MSSQLSLSDLFETPEAPPSWQFGPDLSPQQLRVRDRGLGNQVVVAGAGTGKTETLTQRILKLLIEGDGRSGPVELAQVLALTFTDKGAAEMRGRVYGRLVQIMRGLPRGDLRARLENLRTNFAENNRILTFDAFSFRILGQFPQHSPLDGEVDILDGATRGEMERDITRQFWNRAEASFSDAQKMELWELLDAFSSRRAALTAIAELAEEETEADLRALAILPPRAKWSEEFAALVARDGEKLWEAVESEVGKLAIPADLRAELLDASRVLAGGKGGIVTAKDWSAAFQKRWTPELFPGLERVGKRLRSWRFEALLERDETADWKSRRAVATLCQNALWWQGATREWCATRACRQFCRNRARGTGNDANPRSFFEFEKQFFAPLIDEFQDTNWRQWALLDALRDRDNGNVLVVGDEKQAIFRFRGGDITVFDGVRRILLGQQSADELTTSRRSTRQLVGWTNTVFREVLPSDAARQPFEAPFQALQSEKDGGSNGLWQLRPPRWHFDDENALMGDELPPIATQRQRAGRALARFLRALCDDAAEWVKSDAPGLQFPDLGEISQKSIAASRLSALFSRPTR